MHDGNPPRLELPQPVEPKANRAKRPAHHLSKMSADVGRNVLASYAAEVASVDATSDAVTKAEAAAVAAEVVLLQRIEFDYAAGNLRQRDLAELYQGYRAIGRAGFSGRWNSIVPFDTGCIASGQFTEPHADGSWSGSYPFVYGEALPPRGQSVVYTLIDASGTDCYTGSTDCLRDRLGWHHSDGKRFSSWRAHPYPDREAAYAAEDRMLREYAPYLNRKPSR